MINDGDGLLGKLAFMATVDDGFMLAVLPPTLELAGFFVLSEQGLHGGFEFCEDFLDADLDNSRTDF